MIIEYSSYGVLLTQRQYIKAVFANVINRFGDSIDSITFSWLMYEITNDASLMALIFGLNYIPTILLQPLAGSLVDSMSKRQTIIACDVARGLVVLACALLYMQNSLTAVHLIIMTILISSLEAFRLPAGSAITPLLLEKEYYTIGSAFNQTCWRTIELIGLAIAGGIVAWIGCFGALVIDSLTFFASSLVYCVVYIKENIEQQKLSIVNVFSTFASGLSTVKEHNEILWLTVLGALMNLTLIPFNSLAPAFITTHLEGDANLLSTLQITVIVGVCIGSVISPKIVARFGHIAMIYFGLLSCVGLGLYATSGYFPILSFKTIIAILGCLVMGFSIGIVQVLLSSTFMKVIPTKYMARISGLSNSIMCSLMPIGSLFCSILVRFCSIPLSIILIAALVSILYLCIMKLSNLREI